MLRVLLPALCMLASAFGLYNQIHAQSAFKWPTDASRLLTSVFGEYRPDRIHAGIDIKTWNRTGYKVFSVGEGHVFRVIISPFGYGRAVYVRLNTGQIAMYGHLSRFNTEIERMIRREQERRQRFSVELWLSPGAVPVKQGEVVAYTGRSGTLHPHLHFEFRDRNNRPVNPLTFGFDAVDHAPPVPTQISIKPLTITSHVNDDWTPDVRRLHWNEEGYYSLSAPVAVWGDVGLAVDAYDRNGEYDNNYGVYRIRLLVDGIERFASRFDHFSYWQNRLINLDRDYSLLRNDRGLFYNLYLQKGNNLPFYGDYRAGDGILTFSEEHSRTVPFEIILTDFTGNDTHVKGVFSVRPATTNTIFTETSPESYEEVATGAISEQVQFHVDTDYREEFLRLVFSSGRDLIAPPRVTVVFPDSPKKTIPVRSRSKRRFLAAIPYADIDNETVTVHLSGERPPYHYEDSFPVSVIRVPVTGKYINLEGGVGSVEFGNTDLYERIWFRHAAKQGENTDSKWDIVGNVVYLEPKEVPLRSDIRLILTLPPGEPQPEKLGVYARDNKGSWNYIGHELNPEERTVSVALSSLETVALVRDTIPPEILRIHPGENEELTGATPEIAVWFDDPLSGIGGEDDISLSLDGVSVIAEWDPVMRKLFYVPENSLAHGTHSVRFSARDRMDNPVERTWNFTIQ